MVKIKIRSSKERLIGGAGDYKSDDLFDPHLLDLAINKEISDHGVDPPTAKEIAKDEFTLDDEGYSKELTKKKSRKLSEYWKARARRRAINSKRSWPNGKDYKWALNEQEKSTFINKAIQEFFQKDSITDEDMDLVVEELLEKLKKKRAQKQKMKIVNFGPGTPNKANKSISKTPPKHERGESVKGFADKMRKKLRGPTTAGETFGPQK